MRILYIDTSSSYLFSAIVEDGKLLSEVKEEFGQSLSEVTLPKIAGLFEEAKIEPKEIDKIIVVNGPGSFTGIRIGLTIAKVYAWTLKLPITTIYSLEAMSLSSKNDVIHVPIINARRGYVFGAAFDKDQKVLVKPQHIKLEDLIKQVEDVGPFELISNDEFEELDTVPYDPDMVKIVETFKDKAPINPHAVNPEYLKLTEAEENRL